MSGTRGSPVLERASGPEQDVAGADVTASAAQRLTGAGLGTPAAVADVVVVGGGGAGLAAAISAREIGRDVVLLEKAAELGGTTARSIGSISATGTPYQIRKGIKDSPRDHFEDIPKFNARLGDKPDNPVLRRLLAENVPDTLRWLMSMGVEFMGPMPEPPHRQLRMHNVLPNSRAYIYHLARRARRLGVDIRTGVRASRLLREGERVVGVRCQDSQGGACDVVARGGVVLATGDYAGSREFKARYISEAVARIEPVNPGATGDGHIMAMELGARVLNGELSHFGARFVAPKRPSLVQMLPPNRTLMRLVNMCLERLPAALIRPVIMRFLTSVMVPSGKLFQEGALLINRRGEVVDGQGKEAAIALAAQPDQLAYILLDAKVAKKFSAWPYYVSTAPGIAYAYLQDYRRTRSDIVHEAATLAELAARLGASAEELERTIAQRNEALQDRGAAEQALDTPPYYALGPVKAYIHFTDGGLAVDHNLQVLDAGDRPIAGLFAAGGTGQGGMLLEGHGHHLGWAFTSGRIAGRNAAFLATSEDLET